MADDFLLLNQMLADATSRNAAFTKLYARNYPKVERMILAKSGSEEDAQDVLQEAVVQFYQMVKAGKFREEASVDTVLYAISRNLWLRQIREQRKIVTTPLNDKDHLSAELDWNDLEREQMVRQTIDELSTDCRRIIALYYYQKQSMEQIRIQFGLSSIQVAKTKKYRCMKKLIDLFKKKEASDQTFKED